MLKIITRLEEAPTTTVAAVQPRQEQLSEDNATKKKPVGKKRTRVTTARLLQMSDKQRRDNSTTRADVFMSYLTTGAPLAAVMREAQ